MTEQLCRTCRFWNATGSNLTDREKGKGFTEHQCRRNPPIVLTVARPHDQETTNDTFWPSTYGDDWCGEWEEYQTPEAEALQGERERWC